jgi:hypothetical protein
MAAHPGPGINHSWNCLPGSLFFYIFHLCFSFLKILIQLYCSKRFITFEHLFLNGNLNRILFRQFNYVTNTNNWPYVQQIILFLIYIFLPRTFAFWCSSDHSRSILFKSCSLSLTPGYKSGSAAIVFLDKFLVMIVSLESLIRIFNHLKLIPGPP